MLKKILKKDTFFPKIPLYSLERCLRKKISMVDIGKYVYLYNGTFFTRRYVFFFFLRHGLDIFILTRKFKKTKPYIG